MNYGSTQGKREEREEKISRQDLKGRKGKEFHARFAKLAEEEREEGRVKRRFHARFAKNRKVRQGRKGE